MTITKTKHGIRMEADALDRRSIVELRKNSSSEINAESSFISEMLQDPMGNGVDYENITGEVALFGGPVISDGSNVYFFMDYAVVNFLLGIGDGSSNSPKT